MRQKPIIAAIVMILIVVAVDFLKSVHALQ
jgi:flagellin-like protein